jgi:CRISPR/Cas system-associated exonuclease Cas4 (RecB family)
MIKSIAQLGAAPDSLIQECLGQVSVLDDLEKFIRWQEENKDQLEVKFKVGGSDRGRSIHASSLCKAGACPLRLYYELTGEVESYKYVDMKSSNTFNTGHALHGLLQSYFREMYGDQFNDEVKLQYPDLKVTGSADGLVEWSAVRFIIEIKTIKEGGGFGFEKVQSRPLPDNARQLQIYMKMADAPFGLLIYWNKNGGDIKEHAIRYDPTVWDEVSVVAKRVADAAGGGQMVEGKVGPQCYSCQFRYGCSAKRSANEVRPSGSGRR